MPRAASPRWALLLLLAAPSTRAQLGQLVSPGPLTRAHAKLEGIAACEKCHEKGKQVAAKKCLACHQPVADRIAQKKGVHRDVKEDCVACHVEHAGRDSELRPFDVKAFDHAKVTGFPLDGRHAPLARDCAKCHKGRSFLTVRPECASCHDDPHKGKLGADCASCHTVSVPFKETRRRFDHSRAAFRLEGAHAAVACEKCHVNGAWRGLKFIACADCHRDPHAKPLGVCADCHTPATWKIEKVDHARTGTPLLGRHAAVPCAKCHVKPAVRVKLKPAPCAACHADPHKGVFRADCAACHKETGFKGAPFDHAAKAHFALAGRHAEVTCASCHKAKDGRGVADFRGLKTPCDSCHADVHKGQLGAACESCHGTSTFRLTAFKHPRFPELFAGRHAAVACAACHEGAAGAPKADVSSRLYRGLSAACASCHEDVHKGQLGAKCESCHAVSLPAGAPRFAATGFRHETAAFPLTAKHRDVPCAKCHAKETGSFPAGKGAAVRYEGIARECASCHKDPHLGQLGGRCESCHTTAGFAVPAFRHRAAAFFKGRHGAVDCAKCHKKEERGYPAGRGTAVRYTGLGATCASCHADAHKGALGKSCASCHAVDASFRTASRAFHKSGSFPLEGRHLEVPCASCHLSGVTKGTPTRCYDCHWVRRKDDRYGTRLGVECAECHRPTAWTAVTWDHAARTGVALTGAHRTLACERCHAGGVFRPASAGAPGAMDCYACHRSAYEATREPSHVQAGFPTTCVPCHRASDPAWKGARFDHALYPLAGAHAAQPCAACHRGGVWRGTPTDCYSCHKADYDRTAAPNHLVAGFQTRCESCHGKADASWKQGRYQHVSWPLVGLHAGQPCAACHASGVFRGRPTDCVSCHKPDYDRAASPNHLAAGFPTVCETCHRPADPSWHQGKFDHAARYPLVGVHAAQPCAACHRNGVYSGTPSDCASCHKPDYDRTTSPNHLLAGFQTRCDSCHGASDPTWNQGRYQHVSWPLQGVHAQQPCAKCHGNGVFQGRPNDCASCHQTDYQKTTNPNHAQAGFPVTCAVCHRASDPTWHQGTFDHASRYPLVGVHAQQPCARCHPNGVYTGTPTDCYSCHRSAYDASTNPSHLLAGFQTRCDSCHAATDPTWHQGRYQHVAWPLVGLHAGQPCATCHQNGVFRGRPTDCFSCHQPDYQRAANPNHVTAGFPTTCQTCHRLADPSWHQGTFSHTSFPLVGVHATQACARCHVSGVYAGTPRTCVGCHLAKYQATTNPNHAQAGFPTACETCHRATDASWNQGTFAHATVFPLVGVHATQACARCHVNGVYTGTPRTCVGCHLPQYQATRNPNHVTAGFPTTCETCHRATDATWQQGTFNHTWFPIASGRHSGNPCSACHTNPSSYTVFTCLTCHDRAGTDSKHRGVSGYRYDSQACYACHPQGRAG